MVKVNTTPVQAKEYQVIDIRTNHLLKVYYPNQRKLAYRYADKKDLEYGAITTIVNVVY